MWIISGALLRDYENSRCSPEQAAEYSADTCSAGEPSALLSGPHILRLYLPQDKMTDFSRLSRFGVMCKPLTANHGADVLTWYLAGFPVRTSVQPEGVPESTANDPACGRTWQGLLARYNPILSLWKTPQCSLLEDSDVFLGAWPRSGMTRNGSAYLRETAERPISVTASGFWPTPTVCGNYNRKGASKSSGTGLATAVAMSSTTTPLESSAALTAKARAWPTPTATSYKGWSPNHNRRDSNDRLDYSVERLHFTDGQQTPPRRLNPDWTEWLMGWPIGWTAIAPASPISASTVPTGSRPLETDKFREWRRQHSLNFTGE